MIIYFIFTSSYFFKPICTMPTTGSGTNTNMPNQTPDPLIVNMKQESISLPRFPFSGNPDYLKNSLNIEIRKKPF